MIDPTLTSPRDWAGSPVTPLWYSYPVSVLPGHGETATSLLGRAARANGYARLQDACADQQISFRELANGREFEVGQVARLTSADPELLRFHTPRLDTPGWFTLGRERIKFSAFRRMGGQICPVCMQEDRSINGDSGIYQRGILQVAAIHLCHRHGVVLERNRLACTTREAHDIIPHLKSWAPSQPVTIAESSRCLENYLLDRIMIGRSSAWADGFEFHTVALFCEALGTILRFGPNSRTHDSSARNLIEAGADGFQVFRGGPARITSCLKELQATAGAADQADYGKLYTPLLACLRERRKDTAFDELRRLIREFIIDNFHIPAGTSIFGEVSHTSRVVTIGIAAKEANVPISLLNRQLSFVGAVQGKTSGNTISDRATLIPRGIMDAAVAEVRKLSSFAVTRSMIGADRYTMERLCADGVINLHFPPKDGGMPVFHEDEVVRFVQNLQAATDCGIMQNSDHVRIPEAAARCHCTISELLSHALSGDFRLTSPLDVLLRMPDFYVDISALHLQLSKFPAEFITAATAAKLMGVKPGTIHALAKGEFLPGTMVDYRLANRAVRLFRHADIEAFANEYIVLRALSGTRKANFEETQRYIAANGITPLPLPGDNRKIFRRTDIERIAYLPGGERLARLLLVDEARLHGLFSN